MLPTSAAHHLFEQLAGGPLPDWEQLKGGMRLRRLETGEYLFHAESPACAVYVVAEGLVKMVYQTSEGQEWVKAFAERGMFFASVSALQPGGVASFSALALRPCVIEQIDYGVIRQLASRHFGWQCVLARAFEIYGARKEARERALLTQTPEQRYQCFLLEYPAIAAQISQKDLAGYIRVTPVALSRIKARIRRALPGGGLFPET